MYFANGQCINERKTKKKRHARVFSVSLSLRSQRQSTMLHCHSVFFSFYISFVPSFCVCMYWDCTTLHECVYIKKKKKRKIFMWLYLFRSDLDDALSLLINCFNSFFFSSSAIHNTLFQISTRVSLFAALFSPSFSGILVVTHIFFYFYVDFGVLGKMRLCICCG